MFSKKPSELEVETFDWPDRFLVESNEPVKPHYSGKDTDSEEDVVLVDLSEPKDGWCGCYDFTFNIQPSLHLTTPHRTICKHIIAARDYRNSRTTKPKQLPKEITFK